MNIFFVNPSRLVQSGLEGLARSMSLKGHGVTVMTPRRLKQREADALGVDRVIVYRSIFLPKIRYTLPFFPSQLRVLRKVVVQSQIDLFILYKYFYPTAWIPLLYGRIRGIPVIMITDSFPGISWRYGSKFVDLVARIYSKSLGRLVLRLCDKVIIFSPALLEPARRLGLDGSKLSIIPKGVDLDRFQPGCDPQGVRASLGISPDEAMLLNVGRLVPVKGIDTLIEVTRRLARDGLKVRTVIVGDGPYRDEYERMAAKVRGNVVFAGFRSDIPRLLAACDVFVLPSISEGLPSALLEAAACGKPLVASNTGAIPDVVIHGETGFLAEPGDVESFARHIKLLLDDAEKAARFGARAREHVRRDFDWDAIASRYEDLCVQAIQTKKASR